MTDDAVAVTFTVPADLRAEFRFVAGQHLTLRRMVPDGLESRRSYSICSTPRELTEHGRLRIGVRQVPGGSFSSFAVRDLTPGQTVEVSPPLGHFTTEFDPARRRHYAAVAAGSGITPVLSLLTTALETEPDSRFTLIYGNRSVRTVMFVEELADLKDRYPTRLHLVHVLSREPQSVELLSGRLDADRLDRLLEAIVDPAGVDEWFLCGPYGLVVDARLALAGRGVPDDGIRTELFHVADAITPDTRATSERAPRADASESDASESSEGSQSSEATSDVRIVLDGRVSSFQMRRGERVLDAALRVRPELPYACRGGVCSTCRARLVEGRVEMARNFALEVAELDRGYVLTCQAMPISDALIVDYDA